jgi:hypothetical protein
VESLHGRSAEPEKGFGLEDQQLTKAVGRKVTSEALTFAVFSSPVDEDTICSIPNDTLLVHCVIKRNSWQDGIAGNVYEAVVRPCLLANNFVNGIRFYPVVLGQREFKMEGVYFSQQNSRSAMCGQSAMAMALRGLNCRMPDGSEVTSANILGLMPQTIGDGLTAR